MTDNQWNKIQPGDKIETNGGSLRLVVDTYGSGDRKAIKFKNTKSAQYEHQYMYKASCQKLFKRVIKQ